MNIDDLKLRHSVRSYSDKPLPENIVNSLKAAITDVNIHEAGMNFQLVTDDPSPFKGFSRSYGMFHNVRNYIACVVDTSYANYEERAGYFGMQLLMKAFSMGLDTCFVGGTYSEKQVDVRVRVGEKLLFLIVIGYGEEKQQTALSSFLGKMIHRNSLTPLDFLDSEMPWEEICLKFPLIDKGLTAVSYAPSAMNKQPVGILVQESDSTYNPALPKKKKKDKAAHEADLKSRYDELLNQSSQDAATANADEPHTVIRAYVPAGKPMQLIDLGIAMFCFQVAYPGCWDWGNPATFHPYEE